MSLKILFNGDSDEEPLSRYVSQNLVKIEKTIQSLYDEVWPSWKNLEEVNFSLEFLNSSEMAQINCQYRGIENPTDVLSFPLFEENGAFNPPDFMDQITLGDILVCPEIVKTNAIANGVDEKSELCLILAHGALHLLAWDHDTPEKEASMWQIQERYRDLMLNNISNGKDD